jgi:hypothetical protein
MSMASVESSALSLCLIKHALSSSQ